MVVNPFEAAGDTGGCAEDAARRGAGSLNIRHSGEEGYVIGLRGVWILLVLGSCFNFLLEWFPSPFNDSLFGMVVVEFCCLEGLVVWW